MLYVWSLKVSRNCYLCARWTLQWGLSAIGRFQAADRSLTHNEVHANCQRFWQAFLLESVILIDTVVSKSLHVFPLLPWLPWKIWWWAQCDLPRWWHYSIQVWELTQTHTSGCVLHEVRFCCHGAVRCSLVRKCTWLSVFQLFLSWRLHLLPILRRGRETEEEACTTSAIFSAHLNALLALKYSSTWVSIVSAHTSIRICSKMTGFRALYTTTSAQPGTKGTSSETKLTTRIK